MRVVTEDVEQVPAEDLLTARHRGVETCVTRLHHYEVRRKKRVESGNGSNEEAIIEVHLLHATPCQFGAVESESVMRGRTTSRQENEPPLTREPE